MHRHIGQIAKLCRWTFKLEIGVKGLKAPQSDCYLKISVPLQILC